MMSALMRGYHSRNVSNSSKKAPGTGSANFTVRAEARSRTPMRQKAWENLSLFHPTLEACALWWSQFEEPSLMMSVLSCSWRALAGPALHLVFLISVFDIHFKSPIVQVADPPQPDFPAPANRLVIIGQSSEGMK